MNGNAWILTKNSLKFVPKGPINNIPALVQVMAWRRPCDKPLSEPMMVRIPTHICVTRPPWVNLQTWTIDRLFHGLLAHRPRQSFHADRAVKGGCQPLKSDGKSHRSRESTMHWYHDDVIKWKHFPRYWPFVWGIHRSPVNSPHKGQWRGALMFTLIWHGWVNNRETSDLRRHRAYYDVIIMTGLFLGQPIAKGQSETVDSSQ